MISESCSEWKASRGWWLSEIQRWRRNACDKLLYLWNIYNCKSNTHFCVKTCVKQCNFIYIPLLLTFQSLPVTRCTTSLTFNNCTLCPHCIYGFCIYLRINSDFCHLRHKLIGFYNRDEKCLQRGMDWVFKYSGLRFVCKGLIFMCFIFILEQTATCATYSIN